ncbi:VOC family protein [Gordonia sp. DT30]|uniref:VOC family protein n=1 Tax=unclassified Gordonia (in: high G+C Gram-positive bacteria) TaxID=2657482 RepID=UPI003CFB2EA5
MSLAIGMITFDSDDPVRLGRWWAEQMNGTVVAENDGYFVMVSLGDGRPALGFQKVNDPTRGKNRVHLDLTSDDRGAAARRLVDAGATRVGEYEMGGFAWVTLADPDGNQFCVAAGQ